MQGGCRGGIVYARPGMHARIYFFKCGARMGLQLPRMLEKNMFIRVADQACVLRAWERLAFRFNVERSPAVCECCI